MELLPIVAIHFFSVTISFIPDTGRPGTHVPSAPTDGRMTFQARYDLVVVVVMILMTSVVSIYAGLGYDYDVELFMLKIDPTISNWVFCHLQEVCVYWSVG